MICHNCGKEIPDDAKFCNYCGSPVTNIGLRHARPEPEAEEIYSFSDGATKVFDPDNGDDTKVFVPADEDTKVFTPSDGAVDHDFERFEANRDPVTRDGYDDREYIGDSFDDYSDGEDDRTFMDKLDDRFHRDDDRRQPKNLTWLWIVLSVAAVVIFAVIIIMAVTASNRNRGNVLPTTAPTVAATVTPTENVTEAPEHTDPPETEAPETEAPDPTDPPETEAPPTEAPAPTDPPTEAPVETTPAETDAPIPE